MIPSGDHCEVGRWAVGDADVPEMLNNWDDFLVLPSPNLCQEKSKKK
jgi:hypothetical protein